jgi:serine/threonine protein phosphatase 1
MTGRTFAIGDIHGDFVHLEALARAFPPLGPEDTVIFLGDYLDRGLSSAKVVDFVRTGLRQSTQAKVVALRGSHEDAWLRVRAYRWPEFVIAPANGCLCTLRSFRGQPPPGPDELPTAEELKALYAGSFFPNDVVTWMESLPFYYEDEHAIYVHAGLPRINNRWAHPSELEDPAPLVWQRSAEFYRNYRGKRVVFGHTVVEALPQELSTFTPEDRQDLYFNADLIGLDTCCGHGGFLTAIELPGLVVYESRRVMGG